MNDEQTKKFLEWCEKNDIRSHLQTSLMLRIVRTVPKDQRGEEDQWRKVYRELVEDMQGLFGNLM